MKRKLMFSMLAAAGALGMLPPQALADSAVSTHATIPPPATIKLFNPPHKRWVKQREREQQERRETSYRAWFLRKYGYYPDISQFRDWYYRSYGVYPS